MQNSYKKLMLGVLCSSVLFLSACNDDDNDFFVPQPQVFLGEQTYTQDVMSQAFGLCAITCQMYRIGLQKLLPW